MAELVYRKPQKFDSVYHKDFASAEQSRQRNLACPKYSRLNSFDEFLFLFRDTIEEKATRSVSECQQYLLENLDKYQEFEDAFTYNHIKEMIIKFNSRKGLLEWVWLRLLKDEGYGTYEGQYKTVKQYC